MKNNRFNNWNYFHYGGLYDEDIGKSDINCYNDNEKPTNHYGHNIFGYFRAGGNQRAREELLIKLNKAFSGIFD